MEARNPGCGSGGKQIQLEVMWPCKCPGSALLQNYINPRFAGPRPLRLMQAIST